MTNKITMFFNGQPLGEAKDVVITCADPLNLDAQDDRRFTVIDPAAADLTDIEPLRVLLTDDATAVERVKARLTDMRNSNGVYGKMGVSVEGTLYDPKVVQRVTEEGKRRVSITALPRGGMMVSGSTDHLREYLTRDIEATEELRKHYETEQIITEALAMARRGRPAPLPRPTYLAVAIRAIYDDIESWSRP